jgi:WD40 repeat protein
MKGNLNLLLIIILFILLLFGTNCVVVHNWIDKEGTGEMVVINSKNLISTHYASSHEEPELKLIVQENHTDKILDITFSPCGKFIATCSHDATVKIWNLSGEIIKTYPHHSKLIRSIAFSPDSRYLAVADSWNNTVELIYFYENKIIDLKGHSNEVLSVTFHPDGKHLASSSRGSTDTIILWDMEGKPVKVYDNIHSYIKKMMFHPDGRRFLCATGNKNIEIRDVKSGDLVKKIGSFSDDYKIAFCNDYFVTGGYENILKVWSLEGELLKIFKGHSGYITCIDISPDGKYIVSGSYDNTIKIWSSEGSLIKTFKKNTDHICCIALSPDVRYLAGGTQYTGDIRCWEINKGEVAFTSRHLDPIKNMALSPDKKYLAINTKNFYLLDMTKPSITIIEKIKQADSIAFSPNGQILACAGGKKDSTLTMYYINQDYAVTKKFESEIIVKLYFTKDSNYLLGSLVSIRKIDESAEKKNHDSIEPSPYIKTAKIKIWQAPDRELITTITGKEEPFSDLVFNPYKNIIAAGYYNERLSLFDITGKQIRIFNEKSKHIHCLSVSNDNNYIASGMLDGTIILWDYEGNIIKTLKEEDNRINSLSFNADSSYLLSASDGKNLILWDVHQGKKIKKIPGQHQGATNALFSPNEEYSITSSYSAGIHLLPIDKGDFYTFVTSDREWLIYNNKGEYDCSPGAKIFFKFVKGITVYEPDKFKDSHHISGLMKDVFIKRDNP